ncbi:MAG: hemerythrin domain-containing protein [bacterium]|nr:hemerythrin domain-containing protein [bacterium]
MANRLILTSSGADERREEIKGAINGIGVQEKLIVECSDDFFGSITALLGDIKGEFVWAPLLSGPDLWRGEITKFTTNDAIHTSIVGYMSFDHKRCDELYADAEAAWNEGESATAAELLKSFDLGMKRHLGSEENILFPAFTAATGMEGGPVQVMLMEHDQMRGVLAQMAEAIDAGDLDTAFANGDTMVILMQQHNVKEEGILYPMLEQHAGPDLEETIRNLQTYVAP